MLKTMTEHSIDMRGKEITTFIIYEAATKLREMDEGDVLEIVTDSFEPIESDIRAWCRMTGHRLVNVEKGADLERYFIEKGLPRENDKKLAMLISDEGLLELLSPLGFALAAALEGNAVHIYFLGPAVKVLARGFKGNIHGINRPFSRFARSGLAKSGHILPQEKLAQLQELGAHFYICGPSMKHFRVAREDLVFENVAICEYLTFMEVMNDADIHMHI